jgi:hypothetical protein
MPVFMSIGRNVASDGAALRSWGCTHRSTVPFVILTEPDFQNTCLTDQLVSEKSPEFQKRDNADFHRALTG